MEDQVVEQSLPEETTSTDTADTTSSESDHLDTEDIGKMSSDDDKFEALKNAGVFGDDDAKSEANDVPEEPRRDQAEKSQSDEEPWVTVKVDGEEIRVSQSELVAGYQRQADYTRKSQALAEERRKYDALLQQVAMQNMQQQPKAEQLSKAEQVERQRAAAVTSAEDMLGIPHGEFNEFDPTHQFALQQVMLNQDKEQMAINHRNAVIQDFANQAQQDPLAAEVDANFESYIYKLGAASAKGAEMAPHLIAALTRFKTGQASLDDCELLKLHWNYVRQCVAAPKPAPRRQEVEPPVTEQPGGGHRNDPKPQMSKKALRSKSGDAQFAYLKELGIFN